MGPRPIILSNYAERFDDNHSITRILSLCCSVLPNWFRRMEGHSAHNWESGPTLPPVKLLVPLPTSARAGSHLPCVHTPTSKELPCRQQNRKPPPLPRSNDVAVSNRALIN